jgi:uncharacterized repeat protein (TIGR04076 family)
MADSYDVQITVVSQKGECGYGHKVGDTWTFNGKTPAGICAAAYNVLYPELRMYRFGGILPWTKDPDIYRIVCPDSDNPVVFELKRIKK